MADSKKTKAERRQAAGGKMTKGERKQAKLRRKQLGAAEGSSGDGLELRLAQLEDAVATQAALGEQILHKLDEVLEEARKSA